MHRLIGVAGLARTGKDTVGQYLTQQYNYVRVSLADPIKHYIHVLNPYLADGRRIVDVVEEIGIEAAKEIEEVRRLYQVFGTDVGRDIDNNMWLNLAGRRLDQLEKAVITDVRFPNEAEFVRERGGVVIYIDRPAAVKVNNHASENGLCSEYYDYLIVNNGNLAQLHFKVDTILQKL